MIYYVRVICILALTQRKIFSKNILSYQLNPSYSKVITSNYLNNATKYKQIQNYKEKNLLFFLHQCLTDF